MMADPTGKNTEEPDWDQLQILALVFGSGIAGGWLDRGRLHDQLFEPGKLIFNLKATGSSDFPDGLVANHLLSVQAMAKVLYQQLGLQDTERWEMRNFGEFSQFLHSLPNPPREVLTPLENGYRIIGERIGDLVTAYRQILGAQCSHVVLGGGPLQSEYPRILHAAQARCRAYGLEWKPLQQGIWSLDPACESPWKQALLRTLHEQGDSLSERDRFRLALDTLQLLLSTAEVLPVSAYYLLMETHAESSRFSRVLSVRFDGETVTRFPIPEDLQLEDTESLFLGKALAALLVNRVVTTSYRESNLTEDNLATTLSELGVADSLIAEFQAVIQRTGMGILSGPYHRTNLACRALETGTLAPATLSETLRWFQNQEPRLFPGVDLGGSSAKLTLLQLDRTGLRSLKSAAGNLVEVVPLSDLIVPGESTVEQFTARLITLYSQHFLTIHPRESLADWGMTWPGPVSRAGTICGTSRVLSYFPGQTARIAEATPAQVAGFPLRESLRIAWRAATQNPSGEVHLLNDGQAAAFGSFARLWRWESSNDDAHIRYSLGADGAALNAACGYVARMSQD